jgi:hypothetical protein
MAPRPNVHLILSDQHTAEVLGCQGHPGVRTPRISAWAIALALAVSTGSQRAQSAEDDSVKPFYRTDFEGLTTGWNRRGQAEFAMAEDNPRSGRRSARITVPAAASFNFPQHTLDFTADLAPGDCFDASVWVRSRGVDQAPGAYFVLEFLHGEERVGIFHSGTGADQGAADWERLDILGAAMPTGADRMRVSLILHAHGTAWFDDLEIRRTGRALREFGGGERRLKVASDQVVLERFGGVGFHVFYHCHEASQELLDTVIVKRWRELNPSFARVTHVWDWDEAKTEYVAGQMAIWRETGTEVYLTTWDPLECPDEAALKAYAVKVADMLEFFVQTKGLDNLKTYCLTNELSLKGWGTLVRDLPRFKAYHQAFHKEFVRRRLPVQLLATDASPIGYWGTIEWATEHMDEITGIYGGHHYINDFPLDDAGFYPWFLGRLSWGAGLARAQGKDFILGEFGAKQDGKTINGKRNDACTYWGTAQEPQVPIQLAEAIIAALNAGVYALGYWTFADFPDEYRETYQNKWGTFKWSGQDYGARPHYYALALLTRYFRGPSTVLGVESNDSRVRAAAVRHHGTDTLSLAVVNRNAEAINLRLALPEATGRLRRYVYDPARPPSHPFGDLPGPEAVVTPEDGVLQASFPAGSLVVYTSAFADSVPPPVSGLAVEAVGPGVLLRWTASADSAVRYYRVYRKGAEGVRQIGSTVATSFRDHNGTPNAAAYAVTAVDISGNEGP